MRFTLRFAFLLIVLSPGLSGAAPDKADDAGSRPDAAPMPAQAPKKFEGDSGTISFVGRGNGPVRVIEKDGVERVAEFDLIRFVEPRDAVEDKTPRRAPANPETAGEAEGKAESREAAAAAFERRLRVAPPDAPPPPGPRKTGLRRLEERPAP